jgi:5,5'-dehydrodivanillate O-demethylase
VQYQIRVPIDDTNTRYYWVNCREPEPGQPRRTESPVWENPWQNAEGKYMPEVLNAQDMMVMITQGPVTDHSVEHLAESDRGVALYRRVLHDGVDAVERGEDPSGVVRDPAKNTPWIELPVEKDLGYQLNGAQATTSYDIPDREAVLK